MGFFVEQGQRWERECRSCRERVVLIGSGADVSRCPYCGVTLMDHEGADPLQAMASVSCQAKRYLLAGKGDRGHLKPHLESSLLHLLDDLAFFGKDLSRWHGYRCACGWSGFDAPMELGTGVLHCPKCDGTNIISRRGACVR
jgi:hypothetical protein